MGGPDLSGIGERIRSLLFNRENLAGDGAAQVVGAAARVDDPARFAEQLRALANEYGHMALGRLQILGFQAVQQQLGDRWPLLAERIPEVIETTFRRRLSPQDMFRRYDELVYLVIFTGLTLDEARIKAHFIAEEIWQQLFGMAEVDDTLDVSLLTIDLEAGEVEDLPDLDSALVRHFETAAQEAARLSGDLPWLPPASRPASEPGPGARPPARPAAQPQTPARPQTPAQPQTLVRAAGQSALTYTPLWAVRRNAVSSYYARMRLLLAPRDVLYGHDILRRAASPRDMYEFDLATLARVHAEVQRLGRHRSSAVILCPVHYTTMVNREARQEFLRLCATLPPAAARHLIIEVSGLAEGFPPHTAYEIRHWLKPYCRAAWAQIPPLPAAVRNMKEAGFAAVGFDARHISPARLAATASLFAAAAHGSGLRCYIHALSTPAAALAAVEAGVDLLSGDAIQRPLDKVLTPYRLTREDIAPSGN